MKKLLAAIGRLWVRLRRRRRISHIVRVGSRSELPDKLGRSMYLVGERPKWAILKCPCGCGDTIDVNLMQARSPVWELSVENGKATLYPSLWVSKDKCGAHFWIRHGKIDWV